MLKKILSAGILMVLLQSPAVGGIGGDLMNFFEKSGVMSNVTTPGAHKDQSAGYYDGGGLSVRSRV